MSLNKITKQISGTEKEAENNGRISIFSRFKLTTELTLLVIIVFIFIVMTVVTPNFMTTYNIGNLFKQASVIGIISIAATLVIISGGIDLSVGSLAGLVAMLVSVMISGNYMAKPILPAILITTVAGIVIGIYHGFIIHEIKLPPFIATLGSMIILRGIVKWISQARTIANLPESFTTFAKLSLFNSIPSLVLVWLAAILIIHIVLTRTTFGRNIYVIGSSQEVARLSGIRMRLNIYGIYILAAFLCTIAGILMTSRLSSAIPTGGSGYELTAIASAVIGGASLSGAQGSVIGTMMGTILMVMIVNAGVHLSINPFIMEIVQGALLTVAVVIDMLRQRRS
ncbi:L-arabinose transport system permease protein AraH [subsurface metagenome]